MWDARTATAEQESLASRGLTRREFVAVGAAAVLAGCAGSPRGDLSGGLSEALVDVTTPDGVADAYFVHPSRGRHAGVILWPDAVGLRDAKKVMARRLARAGYAVLAVNQYYRSARAPVPTSLAAWRTPEGRAKMAPMVAVLTPEAVTRDATAFVAFLDSQDSVDRLRGIGTQGYCMGGPFAIRTAAAAPQRVGAAASFHGAGLVTAEDDSPHRLLGRANASYLIAIARNDDERTPAEKDTFRDAAATAGRRAEIEVYAADHGWCVPDSPVHDPVEADRVFERLLALYAAL